MSLKMDLNDRPENRRPSKNKIRSVKIRDEAPFKKIKDK